MITRNNSLIIALLLGVSFIAPALSNSNFSNDNQQQEISLQEKLADLKEQDAAKASMELYTTIGSYFFSENEEGRKRASEHLKDMASRNFQMFEEQFKIVCFTTCTLFSLGKNDINEHKMADFCKERGKAAYEKFISKIAEGNISGTLQAMNPDQETTIRDFSDYLKKQSAGQQLNFADIQNNAGNQAFVNQDGQNTNVSKK
jgi:hypothetical protein